jgi:hypothetical protein
MMARRRAGRTRFGGRPALAALVPIPGPSSTIPAMSSPPAPPSPGSRRSFLALAALTPLAAACATVKIGPAAAGPAAGPSPSPAAPGAADPLALLRAVPLPEGAEPAFVFRAVVPAPWRPAGGEG